MFCILCVCISLSEKMAMATATTKVLWDESLQTLQEKLDARVSSVFDMCGVLGFADPNFLAKLNTLKTPKPAPAAPATPEGQYVDIVLESLESRQKKLFCLRTEVKKVEFQMINVLSMPKPIEDDVAAVFEALKASSYLCGRYISTKATKVPKVTKVKRELTADELAKLRATTPCRDGAACKRKGCAFKHSTPNA